MSNDTSQAVSPIDQAIAAFEQHQLDATCPRCRYQTWDVQVVALEASSFGPQQNPPQRFRIPTVVLTCDGCGNMYLHNLAILLRQGANVTPNVEPEFGGNTVPSLGNDIEVAIDDVEVDLDEDW